jgi:serine/threonine protein kinase/tetratricopeptide (TPR) repeat protein
MPPTFRIERELGAGATGRVHHGILTAPFAGHEAGFELAVKILHPELANDAGALERFELEARAGTAMVGRDGVVHVLYRGEDERGSYLLMPFVPGRSLREVLDQDGPLPEPLWRSVARQVAAGLGALHEAGFVHGDIKPENIRLDAEGRAVLLDLGFAQPAHPLEGAHARKVAPKPGSLAYLSPEQATGEQGTRASDVFSLGVVLFELATGLHPFIRAVGSESASARGPGSSGSSGAIARQAIEKPDADRVLAAIATPRLMAPSRLVPQLSPFLDRLLGEVLQRAPHSRPTAPLLAQLLGEGETGSWWRSHLDFAASARRSAVGERDARHLTPMVGREREMATLQAAFRRATGLDPQSPAVRGGVVWLSGESGSGKSRLVHELAARVRTSQNPPLYLYGRCRRMTEARPGQAVLGLVQRYLRLPPGHAPGERERAAIEKVVPERSATTLIDALTSIDAVLPISVPEAWSDWIVSLSADAPMLVFLDDAMWSRGETQAALEQLAERMAGHAILLVLGLREDAEPHDAVAFARLRAHVDARLPSTEITLKPLDEDAVFELVEELFDHRVPRLRLARVLWQRSRGNPGLLNELLRGLLTRGDATPGPDGALLLHIQPDRLPLPESLPKAIAESYRQLPPEDRLWLRRLAVVGGRIDAEFLLRAFPPSKRAEVDEVLARLARLRWLIPAGPRYRFARPALREAVYGTLSPDQRRRLHTGAAAALESAPEERVPIDHQFHRAFHLRAAGDHATLLGILRPLVELLLHSAQPQRVHALSLWGLEALDALDAAEPAPARNRERVAFLETAIDAADRLGDRTGQRDLLDRLTDLDIDPDADPTTAGRVYLLHGRYAISTGQYGLARGMLRNAVLLFERTGSKLELSEALRRLSGVQGHVGDLEDARPLAKRAIEMAQHAPQRAVAHLALGVVDVLEDRLESALAETESALQLLRTSEDWNLPGAVAAALVLRVRIDRSSGRFERALESSRRAMRLARRAGEKRLEAEATARTGGALHDLGRLEEAEARLRESLLLAEEIEDRRGMALASLFLGLLLATTGEHEASTRLRRASSLANGMGLNRIEAVAHAVLARVARASGDSRQALGLSEHAAQLLEQYGAELFDRIVITGTRVLVLRENGRRSEASKLTRRLRSRLRREHSLFAPEAARMQRRKAEELFGAALDEDGPVYPR